MFFLLFLTAVLQASSSSDSAELRDILGGPYWTLDDSHAMRTAQRVYDYNLGRDRITSAHHAYAHALEGEHIDDYTRKMALLQHYTSMRHIEHNHKDDIAVANDNHQEVVRKHGKESGEAQRSATVRDNLIEHAHLTRHNDEKEANELLESAPPPPYRPNDQAPSYS